MKHVCTGMLDKGTGIQKQLEKGYIQTLGIIPNPQNLNDYVSVNKKLTS